MFEEPREGLEACNDTRSLRAQCTLVIRNRTISHRIVNHVVMLPIFGEIFLRVINDVVCANRADHLQIPCATHASDCGPERLGDLHRKRPHPTRRTIHQNLLPGVDLSLIAKTLQSSECRHRDGGSFLKRTLRRFQRHCVFRNRCVLGATRADRTHGTVRSMAITLLPSLARSDRVPRLCSPASPIWKRSRRSRGATGRAIVPPRRRAPGCKGTDGPRTQAQERSRNCWSGSTDPLSPAARLLLGGGSST